MLQTKERMKARMNTPAMILPDAFQALNALHAAAKKGGVPSKTLGLVELRASQINGCSVCVGMHSRELKKGGETDDRLFAVAAWGGKPLFNGAERAGVAVARAQKRVCGTAETVL